MYLVFRDFPGFLRFYFKYGLLEIRYEQARIRWGFVTIQCGTRGVSFRMHAVNPAINNCTRIGRLAVFFAGSGGAPLRRPARPSDGSASSSPFPDHVLTGPCADHPPVALGTLIREIDRTPASRAKARPSPTDRPSGSVRRAAVRRDPRVWVRFNIVRTGIDGSHPGPMGSPHGHCQAGLGNDGEAFTRSHNFGPHPRGCPSGDAPLGMP